MTSAELGFLFLLHEFNDEAEGPPQSRREPSITKILYRFVQNESFPNVSRSIPNSNEISKTLQILGLHLGGWNNAVKIRLKHSNLITIQNIQYY